MPGVPPPEPTSTIDPSNPRTSSTPASASSNSTRLASTGSFSAVSPGVATTAASQRSSRSDSEVPREDHDEPIRLRPLARRLDLGIVLELLVDDLPLDRGHRLELDPLPRGRGLLGHSQRERVERGLAAVAVAGRVDHDRHALVIAAPKEDRVREVLDRVDRLAVAADQHPEVVALTDDANLLVALLDLDGA